MFAVLMPLSIPLLNSILPSTTISSDFDNFPTLVPYWQDLDSKGKFMVFYTMIFFETFLLLPMIIPLTIAADSIAGERERKTMEALIAAPVRSIEILVGKLLTTMIPSIVITWLSGIVFMVIADLSLYREIGRLLFPNFLSSLLLFGLSPFISLIITQTMIIISTKASGTREAQQIGSLVVIPLFLFLVGESALGILSKPLWTILVALILPILTIILLLFNIRFFDRNFMITNIHG
jgi:ABC-type Na+ efflux pump permease subunit